MSEERETDQVALGVPRASFGMVTEIIKIIEHNEYDYSVEDP